MRLGCKIPSAVIWLNFDRYPCVRQRGANFGTFAALKRMGSAGTMTGHGFRSLAMGVIKECFGYRHEVVERQLSHASGDAYGEAYDRALFLDERRVMMQAYADYLDVAADGKVIAGHFGKAA